MRFLLLIGAVLMSASAYAGPIVYNCSFYADTKCGGITYGSVDSEGYWSEYEYFPSEPRYYDTHTFGFGEWLQARGYSRRYESRRNYSYDDRRGYRPLSEEEPDYQEAPPDRTPITNRTLYRAYIYDGGYRKLGYPCKARLRLIVLQEKPPQAWLDPGQTLCYDDPEDRKEGFEVRLKTTLNNTLIYRLHEVRHTSNAAEWEIVVLDKKR